VQFRRANNNYIKDLKSKRKTRKNLNRKKKISCERKKSAKNKFSPSDQVTQFSRRSRGGSSGEIFDGKWITCVEVIF
jgi:hypothetical protein